MRFLRYTSSAKFSVTRAVFSVAMMLWLATGFQSPQILCLEGENEIHADLDVESCCTQVCPDDCRDECALAKIHHEPECGDCEDLFIAPAGRVHRPSEDDFSSHYVIAPVDPGHQVQALTISPRASPLLAEIFDYKCRIPRSAWLRSGSAPLIC